MPLLCLPELPFDLWDYAFYLHNTYSDESPQVAANYAANIRSRKEVPKTRRNYNGKKPRVLKCGLTPVEVIEKYISTSEPRALGAIAKKCDRADSQSVAWYLNKMVTDKKVKRIGGVYNRKYLLL